MTDEERRRLIDWHRACVRCLVAGLDEPPAPDLTIPDEDPEPAEDEDEQDD